MRKKVLIVFLTLILLLTSVSSASAYTVVPRYNAITAVNTTIYPQTNGIGFDIMVYVPNSETLDSAWIDVEIRNTAGTVVATFSGKKMTKNLSYFYYSNSAGISTSGTYFFTYEIRCYKNSVLIDNPIGTSEVVTYRV